MRGEGGGEGSASSSRTCSKFGEDPLGFGKEESKDWSPRGFRVEDGQNPSAFSGIQTKARSSMASDCENGVDPSRASAIEAGGDGVPSWVLGIREMDFDSGLRRDEGMGFTEK